MTIQDITMADIPVLHTLRPEGWIDVSEHFRYSVLSPMCDPVKVVVADTIVGIGNIIYNADTAWLASIIVLPAYRNQGIGRKITEALVRRIDRSRYQTILLDATEYGHPVYLKLGFKAVSEYVHFSGMPAHFELSSAIVAFEEKHADAVLAIDRLATGEDRSYILREHMAAARLYLYDGKVHGAYFPDLVKGLIIANTSQAGIELMKCRLMDRQDCMLPDSNTAAIQWLYDSGFDISGTSKRMLLGNPISWRGDYIYNVISGARG